MTEKETLVSFQDVSFAYNGATVLEAASFAIPAQTFVSIVGPNAGGKTTLLKLMLGLLTPDRGSITVFGLPPVKARPRIGYMPQHVQFDPHFPVNVLEVVLMGRLGKGTGLDLTAARTGRQPGRPCAGWKWMTSGSGRSWPFPEDSASGS